MFMKNNAPKKAERRLLELLSRLGEAQADTLLEFAEFLATRQGLTADPLTDDTAAIPEPEIIPRPEKESVVKAIKRLAATYPMLDRSKMLNETSTFMTQHIMQGRDAVEIIDELEVVFRRHYERKFFPQEEEKTGE